jgi:hypothetical protein
MDGIILHRSEFLVLMDAVRATAVIGLDNEALFPANVEQKKAIIQEGIARLKERGWLRVENDTHALLPDLLAMAAVVANPEVVFLTVRETPEIGKQLFLHYQADRFVVEQTLPSEQEHRLASLPDVATTIQRIGHILPLAKGEGKGAFTFTMSQTQFFAAKEMVEQGKDEPAAYLFRQAGLPAEGINRLLDAMQEPQFSGTVALLKRQGDEIVDARNLAALQGPDSAWLMYQVQPGEEVLRVEMGEAADLEHLLAQWFQELSS